VSLYCGKIPFFFQKIVHNSQSTSKACLIQNYDKSENFYKPIKKIPQNKIGLIT